MNHTVGDTIKIRRLKDLKCEYGDEGGEYGRIISIKGQVALTRMMIKYCGTQGIIATIESDGYCILKNDNHYRYNPGLFEGEYV